MWLVTAAWLASVLEFSTFFMKTMVPLRLVGIASNVALISYAVLGLMYGAFGQLYPLFVLHACLLPLNVVRLRQLCRLLDAVSAASDEDAIHALIPYMKTESRAAGDVLFRRGDAADKLYVLHSGRVVFPEMGKQVRPGAMFGEAGLFAERGTRSLTAVCEDKCRLSTITKQETLELYFQNPRFGMLLIRLVAGYARHSTPPIEAAGISTRRGEIAACCEPRRREHSSTDTGGVNSS